MRFSCLIVAAVFAASAGIHADAFADTCESATPAQPLTPAWALRRMEDCNRDLQAAQRAVTASLADLRTAGQAPNPTLTVGAGSISPSAGIGAGPLWRKTLDSSLRYEQLVERGGKPALRRRAAEQSSAAARQDVAEIRRQQSLAVLQALVDVASADARGALLADISTLYTESQRANERRTARGDLAPIDAQRQAIEATRAQGDVAQARADALRARLALAGLLALEPVAAALQVDPAVLDPRLPAQAADDAGQRPDVAAARLRVEASRAARDLAQAQARPDVTVGLQLDHWPTSAANPVGTGNTVSVTFSVPLLLRHSFDGELARAVSDSDAAEEVLARLLAAAQAERARMDNELLAARTRQQLLQTQLAPQAEQVARAAELGYAKGALSLLDVLDARRVLRQTRLDLLAARADAARAAFARSRWTSSSAADAATSSPP